MTRIRRSSDDWMKIVQECRTSGLSDAQWCEENGIAVSTLYYHIKSLRKSACDVPAPRKLHTAKPLQEVVPVKILEDYQADETAPHEPVAASEGTCFSDLAKRTYHHGDCIDKSDPAATVDFRELHLTIYNSATDGSIRNIFTALKDLC